MPRKNTISKSQCGIIALLFTTLVLICGAFFSLAGEDVVDLIVTDTPSGEVVVTLPPLFPSETPFPPEGNVPTATPVIVDPSPTVPSSGGWWEVYFTDPVNLRNPNQVSGSVEERLIGYINAAQSSIHIASFEFDL
ncbi:MAG TPA: hypothetical protein VLM78_04960, partial [Anaerolineales bacterium]|nr:hypothetical protein [Anaerolineales bacterium]